MHCIHADCKSQSCSTQSALIAYHCICIYVDTDAYMHLHMCKCVNAYVQMCQCIYASLHIAPSSYDIQVFVFSIPPAIHSSMMPIIRAKMPVFCSSKYELLCFFADVYNSYWCTVDIVSRDIILQVLSQIHIKSQEQKLFVYYIQKYLYILIKVICISHADTCKFLQQSLQCLYLDVLSPCLCLACSNKVIVVTFFLIVKLLDKRHCLFMGWIPFSFCSWISWKMTVADTLGNNFTKTGELSRIVQSDAFFALCLNSVSP